MSPNLVRRAILAAFCCLAIAAPAIARPLKVENLDILTAKGPARFKVEIADTDATRERGLMFRKTLAPDRGMLFDFQPPRMVSFWMKNTLISLDMLFIAPDGRILSIARDATPLSEAPIYSGGLTRGVLEIAGGRAAQLGIQPGDKVRQRIFPRD